MSLERFYFLVVGAAKLADKPTLSALSLFVAQEDDVNKALNGCNAEDCLGESEKTFLEQYRKNFGHKCMWDLAQNPAQRPRTSLKCGAAPCFATSSRRLWHRSQRNGLSG